MNVQGIAIIPPSGAEQLPKLTPELLASVLAKYSRSNEGLVAILKKVDLDNPEASIERILKFVDYGHASIGGLTGGIAMVADDITMTLAYLVMSYAPHADAQESSTRYIKLDAGGLPDWEKLGFDIESSTLADSLARAGLDFYKVEYERLDAHASANPDSIRYPDGATDKAKARIRTNYALDRARYFLPFALRTNIAVVQTARAWTDTISALLSMPLPEARELGEKFAAELRKFAPNLARHARAKPGAQYAYLDREFRGQRATLKSDAIYSARPADPVVALSDLLTRDEWATLLCREQHASRYDRTIDSIAWTTVDVTWPAISIAELRDLNRHRTGHRASHLGAVGFYLPPEIDAYGYRGWITDTFKQLNAFRLSRVPAAAALRIYLLSLGHQTEFRHVMQLDKFVYEAELRTGPGAHFRYAQHLRDAVAALEFKAGVPIREFINLGEAEPE